MANTPQELSDEQLMVQVQQGQEWALGVLYDRYGRRAHSLAYRILGDEHSAEDVVQEAFVSVWRMASSFSHQRGGPRTWLMAVVHHGAVDVLRRRRGLTPRELSLDLEIRPLEAEDLWTEVSNNLDREALDRALAQIPEEQRETIVMAYFEGYTQREISELRLVPLGTVKGRIRMGMDKLREILMPLQPESSQ